MKESETPNIGETFVKLGVELGALRWSVVRLFSTLQKKGTLTSAEISECLDPAKMGNVPGAEAVLAMVARTIEDIRQQIDSDANGEPVQAVTH